MEITFYNASATVRKAEVTSAISTRLHQSLNGECTLDVTMPGKLLPGVIPGDYVRMDTLYFTVSRVQRSSQTAGALFSVSCEHISYLLNDITMPEGTYSGSVSTVLGQILAGTPLSVGSVDVSGSFEIVVKANFNRRQVLQQWATITGAEISYTYTQVNFRTHVGSSAVVNLSEAENVVSLSVQMDAQNSSVNYGVELSRLQTLHLGDEVHIQYASLEVDTTTRVISLDYDYFHPWNISMQCGDYVPTYYDTVLEDLEELEESVEESKVIIQAGTISMSTNWTNTSGVYSQTVTVVGATVTANSKVSLQPTAAQLKNLYDDGVAVVTVENSSGTLTAYAIGAAPSSAMTVQCTVIEVGA